MDSRDHFCYKTPCPECERKRQGNARILAAFTPVSDTDSKSGTRLTQFHRSVSCEGEPCTLCGKPASMKVGEEIMHDDPRPNRHNFTAYVCLECGNRIFCPHLFRAPAPPPAEGTPPLDKRTAGLFGKFRVERTDGSSAPGKKHEGCEYFVLDMMHDWHAIPALRAYADSCEAEYPALAKDLRNAALNLAFERMHHFDPERR